MTIRLLWINFLKILGLEFNILENLQAMSINREKDKEMAKAALEDILNMEKRLPADFDIKRELAEARDERYGNIN